MAGVNGFEESKGRSPPISERDCSFTDWMILAENESIATSAATPSEIEDMYSSSFRLADRLSRQARLQTLFDRPIIGAATRVRTRSRGLRALNAGVLDYCSVEKSDHTPRAPSQS